jgi:hypothetical protein
MLKFVGNKLYYNGKLIGDLTRLRRRTSMTPYMFEPNKLGEKLGLVRAFARHKGTIAYVSDSLLASGKLTEKEWTAARRAA